MSNFRLSISPNLYLDRLLLSKVHKISAKKVKRSCVSWHWWLMQNLKKNWFVASKLTRILIRELTLIWFYTLIGLFHEMYVMFDLKKSRGVIFDGTREWCKIWRETVVWKITWGIWHIFTKALESWDSKLGLLWGIYLYPK